MNLSVVRKRSVPIVNCNCTIFVFSRKYLSSVWMKLLNVNRSFSYTSSLSSLETEDGYRDVEDNDIDS